jgi:hypothetical protein
LSTRRISRSTSERACEVPREQLHVLEAARARLRRGDTELCHVVVHANDPTDAPCRAERVRTIGAAHVENEVRGVEVLDVPVMPRRVHQVLRVDEVRALAGVPDEPHADGLAAAVHDVHGGDERPGPTHAHGASPTTG